jgi:hypothetical protein
LCSACPGVDGAYLDTTFAQLREDYGLVDPYLQKVLGVAPREISRLRLSETGCG